MLELGSSGSVRGVSSNGHPYRDPGSVADSCIATNGNLVSSPCATALRVLVGPWGARQDSPISLDKLPVKLVDRHHRKASAWSLVRPAGSHAIAAFEHIENFKVPFMG